jgi:imidazolonepropionase-like amidohydrolase
VNRLLLLTLSLSAALSAQSLAVRAETLYTAAGPAIPDGVVLIQEGRITAVGRASEVKIPTGLVVRRARVAIPGLVDGRSTVGLSGLLNQAHDQDQLETSAPIQPELRAIDAYNGRDPLVGYLRSLGVTTVHTGHGPGALISGQTFVIKTDATEVTHGVLKAQAMVAATLGDGARAKEAGKAPGTRGKQIAMLRAELVAAQEYARKLKEAEKGKEPGRDLRKETLVQVLRKELPLLATAHRAQDILSLLRLAREFDLDLVLDGGSEAYLVLAELKAAKVWVVLHPTMARSYGEMENLSLETAAKLHAAGIPFTFQSGYEGYVPKTRVVLWEGALAAANGLGFDDTLRALTLAPAKLLGIAERVGSLEKGKDGDLALFDGDPFEFTTHCVGTIINGRVVSEGEETRGAAH